MRLRIKHKRIMLPILLLVLIAIVVAQGCGNDQTAHQGYKITALNSGLGAPNVTVGANCYQPVKFIVTDTQGVAANGIIVDIHTGVFNTQIAKHSEGSFNCANANVSTASDMRLTSDDNGIVSLEFVVTPTAAGQVFFIDVSSGAAVPAELKTAASTTI
jgi:hypothetical protein